MCIFQILSSGMSELPIVGDGCPETGGLGDGGTGACEDEEALYGKEYLEWKKQDQAQVSSQTIAIIFYPESGHG